MGAYQYTFSVRTAQHKKTLEILERWKKNRDNVSEKINLAIQYYYRTVEEPIERGGGGGEQQK